MVGVLAVGAPLLNMSSSAANGRFHVYSQSFETTPYAGRYSGLSTFRLDRTVSSQPSTGCPNPFTGDIQHFAGDPIYQTEWVDITADAQNWMELGTGHQCNDTVRYWYWGYGYAGVWYPINTSGSITEEVSHYFTIVRNPYGYYVFQIDGATMGTQASSQAQFLASGLESYSSAAVVLAYGNTGLWHTLDTGSTWYGWSGRDASTVDAPRMCGRWLSDTSFAIAEASGC